ncbi:transporter substrate-binding domain-containing protein [Propionivibrio dicarboxylicus]|uniref:Polar amino acid transport system substrate-binding protein n=1 Tax=Propionivibrio dicarboxylicus TaxID=83767 RepID=A0A1G8IYT2_9RHOO|nr:transporter substrate-binding domain-containing protein [Propionivibrio dicarboxylicus]SDI24091.1 polar amino acid transport system substrate-binding protein [Propionivibrio dicarboxylicus]
MNDGIALKRLLPCLAAAVLLAACAVGPARKDAAAPASDVRASGVAAEAAAILAPTGRLRVALYPGTPTSILPGANGSEARGVGHDLGRALAARLGVAFEPVVHAKNADVLAAVKSGAADVAFTNASPARAKEMDFSPPYLDIELGYLVAPGVAIADIAGIDRPGVRVAVTAGSTSDGVLSRDLKAATVLRATTVGEGIRLLASGAAEAYATNKSTLFEMADTLPGGRVLAGNWGLERHAIAIPKGREAGLPFLRDFVDQAKRGGTVATAISRAGLRGAVVP